MRFQVFKNGKAVNDFKLCGAYLFGTDGIGIRRAEIAFKNGLVECRKSNLETSGLALLWPIEGFGKVMLPTTCLPEREEPYILNVEIARAKLMQIVNKREDWSFFGGSDGTNEISKEAQTLFVRAIQNISSPAVASQLADKALEKAIAAAERLATRHAEELFATRVKNHEFGRGCMGCRIDESQIGNPVYIEGLTRLFGSVSVPVSWAKVEPVKGEYDFSTVDACVETLAGKRLAIGAGPLLFFSKRYLPDWLVAKGASFEKIREAAYQFVFKVVSRYAGRINAWCPIGGLNVFNHFGFRFEEIVEMTRAASMAVKQGSPRSWRIIEVCNPWGEYYGSMANSIPPLVYMDMVVQSGINFDAFGLQMRFGRNRSGMHVRDMMQISAILDYLAPIAKPLHLSRVAVPSEDVGGNQDGEVAGIWRGKWSESAQSLWLEQCYKIALSKPFVEAVTYSHLSDVEDSTIARSGLLTAQLKPKKAYQRLRKLRKTVFAR